MAAHVRTRKNNHIQLHDVWLQIKPRLQSILIAFLAIWSVVSVMVKQLNQETDWFNAIGTGLLLTIGAGLWIAGTAAVLLMSTENRLQ